MDSIFWFALKKEGETLRQGLFRPRTDRMGHHILATTRSSHHCLCLWRLLDALPSLRLSRQSLAVSALSRVCSLGGNALMADDELMRIDGRNQ